MYCSSISFSNHVFKEFFLIVFNLFFSPVKRVMVSTTVQLVAAQISFKRAPFLPSFSFFKKGNVLEK